MAGAPVEVGIDLADAADESTVLGAVGGDAGGTRAPEKGSPDSVESLCSSAEDPRLNELSQDAFRKISLYLQGEMGQVNEHYEILEKMNWAAVSKYHDMRQITGSVSRSLRQLNDKYASLAPHLTQLEQIEDSIAQLEKAAYQLDSYAKRLEARFKTVKER